MSVRDVSKRKRLQGLPVIRNINEEQSGFRNLNMAEETRAPKPLKAWHKLLFFACLIALLYVFSGNDTKPLSSQQSAVSTLPPRITDLRQSLIEGKRVELYKTTARTLHSEYEQNEVATDMRIDGKIVEISGRITGINKNFLDNVYINLETSNRFMDASVKPVESETNAIARLRKGQQVKFRCQHMGRLMGSPSGSNCVLMD